MKWFERLLLLVSKRFYAIAGLGMVYVLVVSVADIIMNKVFKDPLNWAFDSIGLMAVVATVFAIPRVQLSHGHIEVDTLVSRLSLFWKRVTGILISLLGIGLWGIIGWRSVLYGMDIWESGEVSMSVGMLIYPFIFVQALCAFLVAVVILFQLVRDAGVVNRKDTGVINQ